MKFMVREPVISDDIEARINMRSEARKANAIAREASAKAAHAQGLNRIMATNKRR